MQHAEEFIYSSVYPVVNLFDVLLCAMYVTEFTCKLLERNYLRMQDKLSKLTIILYRINHTVSSFTHLLSKLKLFYYCVIFLCFLSLSVLASLFFCGRSSFGIRWCHVFMNHSGVSNIGIKIWWFGNFVDLCCETSIRSSMRLFLRSILCKNVLT